MPSNGHQNYVAKSLAGYQKLIVTTLKPKSLTLWVHPFLQQTSWFWPKWNLSIFRRVVYACFKVFKPRSRTSGQWSGHLRLIILKGSWMSITPLENNQLTRNEYKLRNIFNSFFSNIVSMDQSYICNISKLSDLVVKASNTKTVLVILSTRKLTPFAHVLLQVIFHRKLKDSI